MAFGLGSEKTNDLRLRLFCSLSPNASTCPMFHRTIKFHRIIETLKQLVISDFFPISLFPFLILLIFAVLSFSC